MHKMDPIHSKLIEGEKVFPIPLFWIVPGGNAWVSDFRFQVRSAAVDVGGSIGNAASLRRSSPASFPFSPFDSRSSISVVTLPEACSSEIKAEPRLTG